MSDRQFVNQIVQLGPEAIPGLPVAATKTLQSLRMTPGVESTNIKLTPMGFIYPTVVSEGQEWTSLDVAGVGTYTELQYLMSAIFGKSPSVPQIGTTGAYTWTNQGGITTIDDAQTYTVEIGDTTFSERVSNALFTDWDFTLSRKEVSFKGKAIGNLLDITAPLSHGAGVSEIQTVTLTGVPTGGTFTLTFNGQTTTPIAFNAANTVVQAALNALPNAQTSGFSVSGAGPWVVTFASPLNNTFFDAFGADGSLLTGGTSPGVSVAITTPGSGATPSALTVVPVLPKEGNIYLDTSFGSIGTTKLGRNFMVTNSVAAKSGPIWPIDRDQSSYAAVVGLAPKASIKLQVEADTQGRSILNYLRTGQTVYVRCDYLSGQNAGTGVKFRWTFDMALKVDSAGKFSDAEGVYVQEFTLQPVADPTAGYAYKSVLINNQSAL